MGLNSNITGMPGVRMDLDKFNKLMEEKQLNAVRLADMMGVNKTTIYNWKSGVTKPTPKSFKQLLAIFGCNKEELLYQEKEPEVEEEKTVPVKVNMSPSPDITTGLMEIIKTQGEQIKTLCESLNTAIDALNGVAERDSAALAEITIEAVNEDFKNWKYNTIRFANKVLTVDKTYKTTNEVLHKAYELLRKEYGVVWEQEKKEFYNINGRTPVSTLELQYWIETTKPTYKNLLTAKLDTLCHKVK